MAALSKKAEALPAAAEPGERPTAPSVDLIVTAKAEMRYRCGFVFSRQPRQVCVSAEQAAQLAADPLLQLERRP